MSPGQPRWSAAVSGASAAGLLDSAASTSSMVQEQIARRGIRDPALLRAMAAVPRERFVPVEARDRAWADSPVSIGAGQTISQPFVVALMIDALRVDRRDRVLEVGAGSGYAAAVLGQLTDRVWALERHEFLALRARAMLAALRYDNVRVIHADGSQGWPPAAPFDAVLVSAGAREVPSALLDQLAPGGRLVIPVGPSGDRQVLWRIERTGPDTYRRDDLGAVSFVPLLPGLPDPEAI